MIANGNYLSSFNNFEPVPTLTYRIFSYLLSATSNEAENFWKVLYYPTADCLSKDNLTFAQKKKLIWKGEANENDFKLFLKPLIGK